VVCWVTTNDLVRKNKTEPSDPDLMARIRLAHLGFQVSREMEIWRCCMPAGVDGGAPVRSGDDEVADRVQRDAGKTRG
jgi:hypothetical protein